MAVKTNLEQLEEVQAAITDVLAGAQEVRIAGKLVRGADLTALQARETVLLKRYETEQATGGNINRVQFAKPT